MNILFFIGNGFDLSLDMKTSYKDFYAYYKGVSSKSDVIKSLKSNISADYETWADLEIGLGEYSSKVKNEEEYLEVIDDLRSSLKQYLTEQYSERAFVADSDKLINDLVNPNSDLEDKDILLFKNYSDRFLNDSHYIDIVTFNYTSTLEDILNYRGTPLTIGINQIRSITHVHGLLDNMMVLGVDNVNQLSNVSFRNNDDIVEEVVKPVYNDSCMNVNNTTVENLIGQADVIVLFGVSIGESDQKWWHLIGTRLKTANIRLLYFPYDSNKDPQLHPNWRKRWIREYLTILRTKLNLGDIDMEQLSKKIYVAVNKPIFKSPVTRDIQA